MNTLAGVDIIEKLPKPLVGVVKIDGLTQIDFLLFNRPHQALRKAIFVRFADCHHADVDFFLPSTGRCHLGRRTEALGRWGGSAGNVRLPAPGATSSAPNEQRDQQF